jgi:hypothetical protein
VGWKGARKVCERHWRGSENNLARTRAHVSQLTFDLNSRLLARRRIEKVHLCGSVPLPQVAADDATATRPYMRRMYHAAILPTGRTANNTQSNPTVI